jgi:hypothetical protein
MATYYKKIKGKNYDKKLLDSAESSVKGKGDGRISLNDAKKILKTVQDAHNYSDIEKNTMKYVRDHYDFTPEADRWFRSEVRKWAATRGSAVKKTGKPARKTSKPKKAAPAAATPRDEEYAAPPVSAGQKKSETQGPQSGPGLLRRIIQFFIVIIILVCIVLLLIPSTRENLKSRFSRIIGSPVQQQKAPETKTPVMEQKQETPTVETKAPVKPEENGEYYTVQVKDDLISISEKVLGNYARWIDLYNANRDIIKYPWMIFPGQKLKIPAAKK